MTAVDLRPARDEPTDRALPNDIAAERAVLGAALLSPALIPELAGILRDDDWYKPGHATIWAAITDRHASGQPVDVLTIAHDVGTHRTIAQTGGPVYISDLAADLPIIHDATAHARIVAEKAQERRTVELGTWLTQAGHSGTDRADVDTRLEKALTERNPALATQASTWAAVDLTDVLAGNAPDDRPTLMPRTDGPCLLYPGAVHTLSGEPTSGKTWLALHAAHLELAAGHPVAFIDFEDRVGRVVNRLLTIGAKPDQIRSHFRYIRPDVAFDPAGRVALGKAITGTTLVIVDGVTEAMTMHGLDLSSNPDVATFYALLPRWIAGHDTTVVLIDHVVKDTERQGRWSIGGQHKVAGLDGAAYTVKAVEPFGRGRKGTARISIAKDRHGHIEEHALGRIAAEFHLDSTDPDISVATLDPPEAMPTTEGGELRPTYLMEKVSRYLEVHPGETTNAIKAAVAGKSQYVAQALQILVTEGYVEAQPGPRNASFHHVTTAFRRDGEDPNE